MTNRTRPTAEQVRRAVNADSQESKTRKPVRSRLRQRLDVSHITNQPKYANKRFGLFNNEGGQIQRLMREGWEVVKGEAFQDVWEPDADQASQQSTVIRLPVGKTGSTDSGEAILMMIDEDIWEEYQEEERQKIRDIEMAMMQHNTATKQLGTDDAEVDTYSPFTGTGAERGLSVKIQNE